MSTHPNVILLLALTPDGLARKTHRSILESSVSGKKDDTIKIGNSEYYHKVMEGEYDDGWQVSANEGDIVFFDLVTYGYGETIEWDKLEAQKRELEEWAKDICQRFNCSYKIFITANYW